ncbi:MAG: adenine phosphoribosyltransferase [Deltaproteobacteria bacterium]|nr:adenine phosphoribosyltransferase [Deltaproteobacteria bacterium]MCL5277814.1 adenine phosphoribosyltransferase [Deltaproteobacteria bacterium]
MEEFDLKKAIREIPDFPKKGILFYDITTLLQDAKAFQRTIDILGNRYIGNDIDRILAIDARGFIIGSALAYKLGKGIVLVRKKGKLPYRTVRASYKLEYGVDEIEIHRDAIKRGDRVLIVDDLLATGGTASAVIQLVRKAGGKIVECAFVIELLGLKGRDRIKPYPAFSLIQYR